MILTGTSVNQPILPPLRRVQDRVELEVVLPVRRRRGAGRRLQQRTGLPGGLRRSDGVDAAETGGCTGPPPSPGIREMGGEIRPPAAHGQRMRRVDSSRPASGDS